MSTFKRQEDIITKESDLDWISGRLTTDKIIQIGKTASPNRRGNEDIIWTPLKENLVPKAAVTSLIKSLDILNAQIKEESSRSLINILINCRDYIDVYFNTTHTHPRYIRYFDKGSKDSIHLKKMIRDSEGGIAYLGNDIHSEKMKYQISVTSLSLREIIINTVGLDEVAHFPSQVKNKIDNYKLRAFLLDSHYRRQDGRGLVDCRKL